MREITRIVTFEGVGYTGIIGKQGESFCIVSQGISVPESEVREIYYRQEDLESTCRQLMDARMKLGKVTRVETKDAVYNIGVHGVTAIEDLGYAYSIIGVDDAIEVHKDAVISTTFRRE